MFAAESAMLCAGRGPSKARAIRSKSLMTLLLSKSKHETVVVSPPWSLVSVVTGEEAGFVPRLACHSEFEMIGLCGRRSLCVRKDDDVRRHGLTRLSGHSVGSSSHLGDPDGAGLIRKTEALDGVFSIGRGDGAFALLTQFRNCAERLICLLSVSGKRAFEFTISR